jgi:hypothetical protein
MVALLPSDRPQARSLRSLERAEDADSRTLTVKGGLKPQALQLLEVVERREREQPEFVG